MGYRLGYSGPEVDVLLQKAYKYSVINNGWAKLDSSDSNPVDLNSLVTQGNYSISFWNNGPVQLNTSGPINVCVTKDSSNSKTYQTIYDAGKVYLRETTGTSFSNTWIEEQNNTDLDINASVPQNPQDNYVWINTTGESPVISIYKESTHNWVPVSAADLAKASVYDPQGIKQPINEYLDKKIDDADLSKAEQDYNTHLNATEISDGMNWTEGTISSTNRYWYSVCYGNGKFVTVAWGTKYFAYSSDGINWTEGTISSTNRYWNSVCYGNGKFVTVAWNSYFAYSTDGINWTEGTISSTSRNWSSICYGNGKYVAVAFNSNYFAYSTDGINWTEGTISSTSRWWYSVCYGNDKFVAVAGNNSNYFAYSTDGITWTEGTISSTGRNWNSVCYGNGKFVTVAGNNSNYFAYSNDGINWTESTISNTGRQWGSVCYGNGKFVAVASETNYFAYSTDGINWTEGTISNTNRYWYSVCYGNDKFVAVASETNYFAYSTTSFPIHVTTEEKTKWNAGISKDDASTIIDALKTEMTSYANEKINTSTQEVSNISDNVNRISSNIDAHIADSSIHLTADDATSFDNKAAGDHKHLNDGHVTVSAANITGMIAVERLDPSVLERNYIVSSYAEMMNLTTNDVQNGDSVFINGLNQSAWFVIDDTKLNEESVSTSEIIVSDTSRNWKEICYSGSKFVAITYDSNIFAYSTDGITWTEVIVSDTNRYWCSICYGNGRFVAIDVGTSSGAQGGGYYTCMVAYSIDGITWTELEISYSIYMDHGSNTKICYGNGMFIALKNTSKYYMYSTDGITWNSSTTNIVGRWMDICYGNDKFVIIESNSNGFEYSTDGITWINVTTSSTYVWRSICYENGRFVVVAEDSNYCIYSDDGINWTDAIISDSTTRAWNTVCYGNNHFVVLSGNSNYYAYSTDGINWTESYIDSDITRSWCSGTYGKNNFIAINNSNIFDSLSITPIGFIQYAAPAKELTWENITNKPSTLAEYNITTFYTKDEINTIYNNILASINEVKNKADEYSAAIPTEIPSNLDETIATNTASANDLNSKVDILIRNTSLNETLKNQLLSLVQNKVVGNIDIALNKTVTVSYVMNVNGGPGLSSSIGTPASSVYTIDLENPSTYKHTVDTTYTNNSVDDHGDEGYYSFSGWSY